MNSKVNTDDSVATKLLSGPALSFEGVSKRYTAGGMSVDALRDVSFVVPRASIVGVIGTSGAGKSTLFRCASALERPDAGRVRVARHDLASLHGASLREARKKVGLVFQQLHLAPSRTAYENVALPLELAGAAPNAIRSRTDELLDWVGLLDRAKSYPKQLSGGQRQRVAIARALATSPELLLCDEPTSALDPATTRSVSDLLRRVRNELGVAVLIITHEMSLARALCDRVVVLECGRVINEGPTEAVMDGFDLGAAVRRILRDAADDLALDTPRMDFEDQELPPWTTTRH
jgi:D-methionine transport system ATP-binding protein